MQVRTQQVVLLGLLAAAAAACAVETAPVYRKDGAEYGVTRGLFRARWWNYYERGRSYAEGGYWAEAEADFRKALDQDGRDRRRARTYGVLHFTDYFPHRELGVCHYHQGRYAEAIRELETSVGAAPSAKAHYFLDRARRQWLLQEGLDARPPEIAISSPAAGEVTRAFLVRVCGSARDDFFVSRVSAGESDFPMDVSQGEVSFCLDVPVEPGRNRITVRAEDLLGRVKEEESEVHVDRQGPQVGIRDIRLAGETEGAGVLLILDGTADDEHAVRKLVLDGQDVPVPAGSERSFAFSRRLSLARGRTRVAFLAEDAAGNRNEGVIELEIPDDAAGPTDAVFAPRLRGAVGRRTAAASGRFGPVDLLAAAADDPGMVRDTGGRAFLRNVPPPRPLRTRPPWPPGVEPVAAGKSIPWRISAEAGREADTTGEGPLIRLKGMGPSQRSYTDTVYIEGHVQSASPVTALTLNGESLLRRPARALFFGVFRKLEPGENELLLRAEDDRGRRAEERVLIEYVVPTAWRLESRLKVFVIPFRHVRCEEALGEYASKHFLFSLVSRGRFHVLNREELDRVLEEQKLALTEAVDPKTAVRLGRLALADEALVGTVYEGSRSLEIFAQMVDAETGEVLLEKDAFHEEKGPERVREMTRGLAWKFEHALPLVHGSVLAVDGRRLTADLGTAHDLLRPGTRLTVFREKAEVVHPATGRVIGRDTEELGEAVLRSSGPGRAVAELLGARASRGAAPGDLVITK